MKILQITIVLAALSALPVGVAAANGVVVAGSHLTSPPPFFGTSFWGVTATIDRAFPFEVIAGGPYVVDELQVAAYKYPPPTGASTAQFALHVDDNGRPGASFASFVLPSIPTVAEILTMVPQGSGDVMLHSNTPYWIVGGTTQGQLNWNLAANIFGTAAFRVGAAEWEILNPSNISAFALIGSRVPEPSAIALLSHGHGTVHFSLEATRAPR